VQTAPDTEIIALDSQTLRVRKTTDPQSGSRILLLIHGFTGDENSMWVFTRELPSYYWIVAPRAPYVAEAGGYSWRPNQTSELGLSRFEELQASAEALMHLIDAYRASAGIETDAFDVMGFSQGAAMSSLLAFLYPDRVGKLGILAGFVPSGLDALAEQRPLEGKPVFVAHGTRDETVPIERARASIRILEKAGARVTYCEDDVGHKLSIACLHALKKFFAGS
jgi:phospholipase/carboxylesterase